MSADDAVTAWIAKLGKGDSRAAQQIWDRYFQQLANYAGRKLKKLSLRAADEEDAALSALQSFCRGAARGRFPQLAGRDELWPLLLTITSRKVSAQRRRERAVKRGGGNVRGESVFGPRWAADDDAGIDAVLGREPTPELANLLADDCRRLLDLLGDETLREVAQLKLEGYTCEEIAFRTGCVPRTVERKLQRIRDKWSKEPVA